MISLLLSAIVGICDLVVLTSLGLMDHRRHIDMFHADVGIIKYLWYGEHLYYLERYPSTWNFRVAHRDFLGIILQDSHGYVFLLF